MLPWPSDVFMDVVVVVEFKNVHADNHSDEVAKTLFAYGGGRAVAGVEEVPTGVNTLVVWNIGVE